MSMRVVIADDHCLVRAGISSLLADMPEIDIVGEASNGEEAVHEVGERRPDLLLLDVAMPGMSGLDALAVITARFPAVRVIILSMHDSEEHVLRALKLGAVGFMLKSSAPEELAQAIQVVREGGTWLSAAVSGTVIADYLARSGGAAMTGRKSPGD